MSHPLSNNRVMVNEVVDTGEGTVEDKAITSKALAIRPSPSNSLSLKLDPLNLLLLPPLQLLTPSSSDMGTSHPPSLSLLHHPHHFT